MTMETEEKVIAKICHRRQVGRKKYQKTMERDDLSLLDWARHAQEEALDFAIYLQKIIDMKSKKPMTYKEFAKKFGVGPAWPP